VPRHGSRRRHAARRLPDVGAPTGRSHRTRCGRVPAHRRARSSRVRVPGGRRARARRSVLRSPTMMTFSCSTTRLHKIATPLAPLLTCERTARYLYPGPVTKGSFHACQPTNVFPVAPPRARRRANRLWASARRTPAPPSLCTTSYSCLGRHRRAYAQRHRAGSRCPWPRRRPYSRCPRPFVI
jgi:hypothetical protein